MKSASDLPIINVSTTSELTAAYSTLSKSGGGTISVSSGDEPIEIDLKGGGSDHVMIQSADLANPTDLVRVSFRDVENVSVKGFDVDSTGIARPGWYSDLMVFSSENVTITDTDFTSKGEGLLDYHDPDSTGGRIMGRVEDSRDFTFEDNTVSNYFHGLGIYETVDITVSGNEFTAMQGDGIRLAGVQNVEISENYLHDFLGSAKSANHDDFIQIWSYGTTLLTSNVTITDNILDTGEGTSAQGIFIGNEEFKHGQEDRAYQEIVISNNFVHSGTANGIYVLGAENVEVSNNTLLWNQSAGEYRNADSDGFSTAPRIVLEDITNGDLLFNIAPTFARDGNINAVGNQTISYGSSNADNFVDNHFVDAGGASEETGDFLQLRPDSSFVGTVGSSHIAPVTQSAGGVDAVFTVDRSDQDPQTYTLDAGLSVDGAGYLGNAYDFVWTIGDDTVLEGRQVQHTFDTPGTETVRLDVFRDGELLDSSGRNLPVQSNELLSLDLTGTDVTDTSDYGSSVDIVGADAVGGGYRIGGKDRITVDTDEGQLESLASFGLDVEFKILDDDAGKLLTHNTFSVWISNYGNVMVDLWTDEGSFRVNTTDGSPADGKVHSVSVTYDGEMLSLYLDDELIDESEASGFTSSKDVQGLTLGGRFGGGVDAVVSQAQFHSTPEGLFGENDDMSDDNSSTSKDNVPQEPSADVFPADPDPVTPDPVDDTPDPVDDDKADPPVPAKPITPRPNNNTDNDTSDDDEPGARFEHEAPATPPKMLEIIRAIHQNVGNNVSRPVLEDQEYIFNDRSSDPEPRAVDEPFRFLDLLGGRGTLLNDIVPDVPAEDPQDRDDDANSTMSDFLMMF